MSLPELKLQDILKKLTKYLPTPDVTTPANDFVQFFDENNGNVDSRLRKENKVFAYRSSQWR